MVNLSVIHLERPVLRPDLLDFYNRHLAGTITIDELVGMVIFIEIFALEEERSLIREGYITALNQRFDRHDIGRKDTHGLLMDVVRRRVGIGINPKMFYRGIPLPEQVGRLAQYRKYHQNHFLAIGEHIEAIYDNIKAYYLNSGSYPKLLHLKNYCYGGVPRITRTSEMFIELTVGIQEIY